MPHGIINHFIRTAKHAAWSLNKQFTIPNTGHLVIRCKPFTTIGIILYSMFKDTINDHCDQKVFCSLKPFLLFKKAILWLRHTYNDKQQQELKFISTTSIFCMTFPSKLVAWPSGRTRSLAGELSLSCARPAADGWPLMWVNCPLQVSQLGRLSLSSFLGQ